MASHLFPVNEKGSSWARWNSSGDERLGGQSEGHREAQRTGAPPPHRRNQHSYPHCWRCRSPKHLGDRAVVRLHGQPRRGKGPWPRSTNAVDPHGAATGSTTCFRPPRLVHLPAAHGASPSPSSRKCGEPLLERSAFKRVVRGRAAIGRGTLVRKDAAHSARRHEVAMRQQFSRNRTSSIWFDSGVSWAAVCRKQELNTPPTSISRGRPARGWFHSFAHPGKATPPTRRC